MKKYAVLTLLLYAFAGSALTGCSPEQDIGQEEARKIALDHAQVIESSIDNLRISRGDEDGEKTYEIEFRFQNWEYDYEIAAKDGRILSAEEEMWETHNPLAR